MRRCERNLSRMESKLTNAVGLSMKAGKLKSGDFTVEQVVRSGQAKLVLLDESASGNTREKYQAMCEHHGVELLEIGELGRWIGKPGRMIAAVTDENFKNMIKRATMEKKAIVCEIRGGNDGNGKE